MPCKTYYHTVPEAKAAAPKYDQPGHILTLVPALLLYVPLGQLLQELYQLDSRNWLGVLTRLLWNIPKNDNIAKDAVSRDVLCKDGWGGGISSQAAT